LQNFGPRLTPGNDADDAAFEAAFDERLMDAIDQPSPANSWKALENVASEGTSARRSHPQMRRKEPSTRRRSMRAFVEDRLVGEGTSVPEASRILKVHKTTLYRALET